MLISVAGSQGSGKSTVLRALQDLDFSIIERKTSRSILSEWDTTLDAVNSDLNLKMKFQMELVERKYQDEMEYANTSDIVFTERTFSDLFTYALITLGPYNEYSGWLDEYYQKCTKYQHYTHVFYLPSGCFGKVTADGVRSTNKHYSKMIDDVLFDFTQQSVYAENLTTILNANLAERVDIIVDQVNMIFRSKK